MARQVRHTPPPPTFFYKSIIPQELLAAIYKSVIPKELFVDAMQEYHFMRFNFEPMQGLTSSWRRD